MEPFWKVRQKINEKFSKYFPGPSRVHNQNRFLIILDNGIIRYFAKTMVSELRFSQTAEEIDESMRVLSGVQSNSRAAMYVRLGCPLFYVEKFGRFHRKPILDGS